MLTERLATATDDALLAAAPDLDRAVHHALSYAAATTAALAAECPPGDGLAAITAARYANQLRDTAALLPRSPQTPTAIPETVTGDDTAQLTRKLTDLLAAVHERCLDACLTADADGYLLYSRVALQSGRLAELLSGRAVA